MDEGTGMPALNRFYMLTDHGRNTLENNSGEQFKGMLKEHAASEVLGNGVGGFITGGDLDLDSNKPFGKR